MIEQIAHIAGILITLLEGYFFYQILSCLMQPKLHNLLSAVSIIAYAAITSVVVYPQDPVNITLMLLFFLMTNYISFRERWLIHISVIMLFYPVIIALNYMVYEIFSTIVLHFFGEGTTGNTVFYNLSFLIPALFWFFYGRVLKKSLHDIRDFLDTRSWILLDIICLASMAAIFSCIFYSPEKTWKIIPCMTACAITNIGSIRLACDLADRVRGQMERKHLKAQQNYYEELERNQQTLRKFRHDMKNHFAAAGELLREGNAAKAQEYLDQLSGHMETRLRQFCKNELLNAVLNVKYNAALEHDIDSFFHISIDGMAGLDNISLCTLFANTIDNAIEACAKIEDTKKRRLSVKARYSENGYFSCEIANTKKNDIHIKHGQYLTDKEDAKSHGLGISSVQEIVDRYKGTMDISYTEEEFRVVILIEVS